MPTCVSTMVSLKGKKNYKWKDDNFLKKIYEVYNILKNTGVLLERFCEC